MLRNINSATEFTERIRLRLSSDSAYCALLIGMVFRR